MIRAAGILIVCDGKALFLKRGPGSDHPGEWCFPGGQLEDNESPHAAAVRETIEEIGFLPAGKQLDHTRSIAPAESTVPGVPGEDVDYTTFLQNTPQQVTPRLSDEHTGYAWASVDEPPEPLHPGCRIALERLTMDELGIARAMAAGRLTSPQKYMNVWLFAMRITGTGLAYRSAKKEYVWRDAALYINDDFLARCNGLPVIWEHPKKALLDSDEFSARIIGSIMLPYIQGEDVWGMAKIHDEPAAQLMQDKQYSTSPSVLLGGESDTMLKTADGTPLLIEGKPILLDHLAVCEQGVWDKGGDPVGVLSNSVGETSMADSEHEAREAAMQAKIDEAVAAGVAKALAARADSEAAASTGKALDTILEQLKLTAARMDSIESNFGEEKKIKEDAEEEEKKKADAEKKAMMDAEHEEWKKEDAAMCAKEDAEEEKEKKEFVEKGEPEEVAADKARMARRDRAKARKDAAAEEEKAKADSARADAIKKLVDAELAKRLPQNDSEEDRQAKAQIQARADGFYQGFGARAPAPMLGETTRDYRTRLATGLQKHSKDWKGVELHVLPDSALKIAEDRIYADSVEAARNPTDVAPGQLREVRKTDPDTGMRITEFFGPSTYIKGMMRPNRRAVKFNTERRG